MSRSLGGAAIGATLLAGCSGGAKEPPPAPPPSALVSVATPVQGSLPDLVTAYGSAAPSVTGSQTLSVQQPGQVTQLFVAPGATVSAGQPLVTFAAAPTTLSAFTQATTALSAAQKQRATTAQLLTQQLATRDQLAQGDKAVADAAAALEALRREGAGQPVRTLTAPFAGVVTTVTAAQGDRTQPGAALVTIARTGGVVVTAGVDPAVRTRLAVGEPAVLDRLTGGPPLSGRVLRVGGQLNAKTRQVDVDLGFPVGAILPGESLRVGIRVGDVAGWLVPHRAVVTASGPPHVFQAVNGKAALVNVSVALETPDQDVVRGPIDPAKPLIVDGAYQVEAGAPVRQAPR